MAIKNKFGHRVFAKPGSGDNTPVPVGKEGYSGEQDGFVMPNIRPGFVYKTVDGVDVEILEDGTFIETYNGNVIQAGISLFGQDLKGGWFGEPTPEMGKDWDPLFEKSEDLGEPKDQKDTSRGQTGRQGGVGGGSGAGRQVWSNRPSGAFTGNTGGGGRGIVTIKDLTSREE